MTTKEIERLARVEERTQSIEEKLDGLVAKFDRFVETSDKKFITRLEGKAAAWIIGIALTGMSVWALIRKP